MNHLLFTFARNTGRGGLSLSFVLSMYFRLLEITIVDYSVSLHLVRGGGFPICGDVAVDLRFCV